MSIPPPTVSVVMPVRNAEGPLPRALQSIVDQTLTDWEMLAIDDGSEDATPELLRDCAARDGRVRVLSAPQRGLVAALNLGLASARSGLIARMDADDISHPDRLVQQVRYLQEHPEVGLVGCRVAFGGDRARSGGYARHVDWLNSLVHHDEIRLNRFVESPFAHPSVLFRKALVEPLGGYREGPFPEDYELWLRWLDAGVRVAKVPETLLTWNDPPGRLSRTDPRYRSDAFYAVKAGYLAKALLTTLRGRRLWIWGAGRPTRKRADLLCDHGVEIAGYIDIDPAKAGRCLGNRPVIPPAELPSPTEAVVVTYVANRGARELIRPQLTERGFVEGQDFWMAA